MLLSIGMIVKNEEKWLEKCLSAIKPILDNVDCELIITDTGSTDKTVAIAQKYTDKVFHFDWCNDFAVARNYGLKKAVGEWFMYLDADDIFESCDGIIDFFNSGEYRKYNSAAYTSHNLTGTGNTFVDYRAPRLTKLTPKTGFVGIVHEHLNTFGDPLKNIYDNAVHYGYLYENETSRRKKFERNSELLLKTLEQNGDKDPIIYSELFECFMGYDDKKAINYLNSGISVCKKQKHFLITVMYSLKAYAFYTENNFKEALKVCDEYFGIDNNVKHGVTALDAEVYAIKASSLYKIHHFDEAYVAFEYFFVVFSEVRAGNIHTSDMYAAQFYMATESNYIRFMCDFLNCGINIKKYDETLGFISNYSPTKFAYDKEKLPEVIDLVVRMLFESTNKYFEVCRDVLDEYGQELLDLRISENNSGYNDQFGSNQLLNVDEFTKLADKVKHNIRNFIESGDTVTARRLLIEYEMIAPNDNDIVELRSLIT